MHAGNWKSGAYLFPEHDEQSAIAVHAIGSGSGPGGGQNPDNKRFSDPSGSAMDMTPEIFVMFLILAEALCCI